MGRDRSRGGLVWLAVGALAPVIAITTTPLVGVPMVSVATIAAVFYICAGIAVAVDPEIRAGTVGALRSTAVASKPAPEMVRTIAAPGRSMRASVVGAEGVCPMGYRVGDAWTVAANGRLSKAVCAPAASALGSLLKPSTQAAGAPRMAACACPLGSQRVVVFVEPATAS